MDNDMIFKPKMDEKERNKKLKCWRSAVEMLKLP